MDSSGPEFCLLCRSALPTDSYDWYTQHLENVHTVYFHIDLFMALTFVGDEKLEKLTSYIKSISKIQTSDADKTAKHQGDDDKVVDAASESTVVLKRDNSGLKRKSLDEIESKPSKLKKDSVDVEPEPVLFCGPFRCTECGWKSDPTKNALADSALKHWSEVHGSVLKMELEDVPTEELVTLQELFKFVAKCSLPECLAVYGSSTNKNDCLLKIKLHWITQHRNVPQVSDSFKHVFLVNTETPQSIVDQVGDMGGAGNGGTIEVDEEDSDVDLDDLEMQNNADEVANLMDKIDQIKKDLNNEKLKSTSNDDSDNDEKVSQDFGKSGMTCYDCGQANLNQRNFLQHWNSNHFGKDIAHFRLVCNDTKMKAEAKNLLNFICKCSSLDCGVYIGVNHSSKVLEGAVKDHYSNAHAKTLSEISTPEHYIYLDTNMKTIQSQTEAKIEFRDSSSSQVDCLIDGCKSTKVKKYSRHYQQKHKHIPVEQIKVRSGDKILGLSDLYTWILECGAPNCAANIFSVQKNSSVKDSFSKHWSKNHPNLGENHIYTTVLSPSDSMVLVKTPKKENYLSLQETSSPLDSSFRDASSPLYSSFKDSSSPLDSSFKDSSSPLESSFKETSSSPVDCLLEGCKPKDSKDISQYIRHYRQNHEDIPVDQIKVRSVQSGNILGLSDLFSWVLQCEAPNCSAIKTSVQRNNSVRDTFRKHWNRSHPNLGKKFLYKTILSPSNSTLLEIKSISPKKENSLKPSPDASKMTNFTMECTLCQHSTRTALLHWRSHHPEHPATSLRMRRLEDDKIMNLRGVYNIVLKCKMNKCTFVTVANKGRPISQPKKLMKKHLEDEHEEENLDDNMEEVESLGYVCLMEGCQMAVGSRKEFVEHHETHHGKLTEVLARDLDTDEKKGLVDLFKIVKECGWKCGKIFYSDFQEEVEKELAGHCEEEHPGVQSRQHTDLSKEMNKEHIEGEDEVLNESLVMKDWQDNDVQEELAEQVEANVNIIDEKLRETDGHKELENHMEVNDSSREKLIEKELKESNEQLDESDLSLEDEDLDDSQEVDEDSNEISQEKLAKAMINEPAYSQEDSKVHEEQVTQMVTEMSQEKLAEEALENLNEQDYSLEENELDEFGISEEELTEEALEKLNELAEEALEKLKESLNEQDDSQGDKLDEQMDENEKIEEQVSEEEDEMSDEELDEEEVEDTFQEVDEVHDKLDAVDELNAVDELDAVDENDMMEEELSEEEHEISEDELEEEEVEDTLPEDDKAEAAEELDELRDGTKKSLEVLSEDLKESGEQDEELEELDEHDQI